MVFVAGQILTAAQLNAITSDAFPLGIGAWTNYTPSLTQGATVTKTLTYAKWTQIGKTAFFTLTLTVTGAGTAANNIVVGLPAVAQSQSVVAYGSVFDSSASLRYHFVAFCNAASTVVLASTTSTVNGFLGSTVFTAALAVGDVVQMNGFFEVP